MGISCLKTCSTLNWYLYDVQVQWLNAGQCLQWMPWCKWMPCVDAVVCSGKLGDSAGTTACGAWLTLGTLLEGPDTCELQ